MTTQNRIRGFKNLAIVNGTLKELYLRLSPVGLRQFSHNFELTHYEKNESDDPAIRTQKFARCLANHYRIKVAAVIVAFRSDISVSGRVELSPASEFFVEIKSEYQQSPKSILAILAHEIAHIFLFQAGIRLEPVFHNEVLTDTTAAFLGCGSAVLNGILIRSKTSGNNTETEYHHFGYISIDEIGYLQAKRDAYFRLDSHKLIDRGLPMLGYRSGKARLESELSSKPFVQPHILDRISRKIVSCFERSKKEHRDNLVFACGFCSQCLRIPLIGKKISVHCPTCKETFICYT